MENLPDEYEGRCKLVLTWGAHRSSAVFPNLNQARHAANLALNPLFGGVYRSLH